MTFLNPAVLIGLLAAAIPVILHFINLRKIKEVEFSTLYFLKELKKSRIRNLKIKQWLLLFLRLSIIIFLVLAFAKPAVKNSAIATVSEKAKKVTVIVFDDSFSMAQKEGDVSDFGLAKNMAGEIINASGVSDEIYLISSTSPGKIYGRKEALKMLARAEISFVKGNLTAAISSALKIAESKQTLNKEIFILSDFQKSNLSVKEIKKLRVGDNVKISAVVFGKKKISNLSLNAAALKGQIIFPGKTVALELKVKNSGEVTASKTLSLFVNNERTAQQNVSFAPGKRKNVLLKSLIKTSGLTEIVAYCEDDNILYDNRRFIGLNVKNRISIAVSASEKGKAKYLLSALSKDVSRLDDTKFIPSSRLSASALNSVDVLFLIGNASERVLRDFISKGKTVVIFPEEKTREAFTELLKNLRCVKSGELNFSKDSPLLFDKINFENPLFGEIYESSKKERVNSPRIKRYVKMKINPDCEKIISLEDNSPFLFAKKINKGKIYVFSVSPDKNWSDFQFKPLFAPLMNRIAMFSAAGNIKYENVLAGEPFLLDIRKSEIPQFKIVAPNEKEYYVNAGDKAPGRFVKFGETETPGFYYVYSRDKLVDYFTVNFDASEAEREFYGGNELNSIFPANVEFFAAEKLSVADLLKQYNGAELWRLFLILTLFAAFGEMLVARTAKKDFEEIYGS